MTTIETTFDAFLGGRITLEQPTKGYRAGVDPVLLAASVPARAGQSVLELGCGTGAALLCLASRVEDLDLRGIEMQPHYADLCRANVDANRFGATIYTADLRALPADLTALSFDQILANPPYFQRNAGHSSPHEDRDIAFGGATKTQDWLDVAYRRLKPQRLADIDPKGGPPARNSARAGCSIWIHHCDANRGSTRAQCGSVYPSGAQTRNDAVCPQRAGRFASRRHASTRRRRLPPKHQSRFTRWRTIPLPRLIISQCFEGVLYSLPDCCSAA